MKQEILSITDLVVQYHGHNLLDHYHFRVNLDEMVYIVGAAGSGKSILMDVMEGHIPYSEGEIVFCGKVIRSMDRNMAMEGALFIRTRHMLMDQLTVAENLSVKREKSKPFLMNQRKIIEEAKHLLEAFELDIDPRIKAVALKSYQKHEIELLLSVVRGVKLVVIDDILKEYPEHERNSLIRIIIKLRSFGISIVMCSRKVEIDSVLIDRMVVINNGRHIRTFVSPLFNMEDLGNCLMIGRQELDIQTEHYRDDSMSKKMFKYGLRLSANKPLISVSMYKNEILGLYDRDKDFQLESIEKCLKDKMGVITNKVIEEQLILGMSIYDNLALQIHKKISPLGIINKQTREHLINVFSDDMHIHGAVWNRPMKYFDAYTQTMILYKRWLLARPRALILVEPFMRADAIMQNHIHYLIHEFIKESIPVIICSSDLKNLENICHRIIETS